MATGQPPGSTSDYSKLTVPQLKVICKGLKITGYSKLGKAALLQKLKENPSTNATHSKLPVENSEALHALATAKKALEEEPLSPRQGSSLLQAPMPIPRAVSPPQKPSNRQNDPSRKIGRAHV